MHFIFIADSYAPLNNSCAVQMEDLASKFIEIGHEVTILVPSYENRIIREERKKIIYIKILLQIRSKSYFLRLMSEFIMPYCMILNLKMYNYKLKNVEGVISYSPSIFFSPLIKYLKITYKCRNYLVLRDIFPKWAYDLGIIKNRFVYALLHYFEKKQYNISDVVGVQTKGNLKYIESINIKNPKCFEVLHNWLSHRTKKKFDIESKIEIKNKRIFVYAGNMGKAQNLDRLLGLAEYFLIKSEYYFLFIGRGSEVNKLKDQVFKKKLINCKFLDEIKPEEILSVYDQCYVGMISLNHNHTTHNIPGKLLSYLFSGLPVLADINPNSDLEKLIINKSVGKVCSTNKKSDLVNQALSLISQIETDKKINIRCKNAFEDLFSTNIAVNQILKGLSTSR